MGRLSVRCITTLLAALLLSSFLASVAVAREYTRALTSLLMPLQPVEGETDLLEDVLWTFIISESGAYRGNSYAEQIFGTLALMVGYSEPPPSETVEGGAEPEEVVNAWETWLNDFDAHVDENVAEETLRANIKDAIAVGSSVLSWVKSLGDLKEELKEFRAKIKQEAKTEASKPKTLSDSLEGAARADGTEVKTGILVRLKRNVDLSKIEELGTGAKVFALTVLIVGLVNTILNIRDNVVEYRSAEIEGQKVEPVTICLNLVYSIGTAFLSILETAASVSTELAKVIANVVWKRVLMAAAAVAMEIISWYLFLSSYRGMIEEGLKPSEVIKDPYFWADLIGALGGLCLTVASVVKALALAGFIAEATAATVAAAATGVGVVLVAISLIILFYAMKYYVSWDQWEELKPKLEEQLSLAITHLLIPYHAIKENFDPEKLEEAKKRHQAIAEAFGTIAEKLESQGSPRAFIADALVNQLYYSKVADREAELANRLGEYVEAVEDFMASTLIDYEKSYGDYTFYIHARAVGVWAVNVTGPNGFWVHAPLQEPWVDPSTGEVKEGLFKGYMWHYEAAPHYHLGPFGYTFDEVYEIVERLPYGGTRRRYDGDYLDLIIFGLDGSWTGSALLLGPENLRVMTVSGGTPFKFYTYEYTIMDHSRPIKREPLEDWLDAINSGMSEVQGGNIISAMLFGSALGAFAFPYVANKYGVKRSSLLIAILGVILWLVFRVNPPFAIYLLISFLFGVCLQATWPVALHCQETEKGVNEKNVGIAASLYISVSNVGGAILPVAIGKVADQSLNNAFILLLAYLVIFTILWGIVRRK